MLHLVRADRPAHGADRAEGPVPDEARPGLALLAAARGDLELRVAEAVPRVLGAPLRRAGRGLARRQLLVRGAAAEAPAAHDALLLRPGLGGLEPGGAPLRARRVVPLRVRVAPAADREAVEPDELALALDELVVARDVVHLLVEGRRVVAVDDVRHLVPHDLEAVLEAHELVRPRAAQAQRDRVRGAGPVAAAPAAHAQVRAHVLALAAADLDQPLDLPAARLEHVVGVLLDAEQELARLVGVRDLLDLLDLPDRVVVQGAALGHRLRAWGAPTACRADGWERGRFSVARRGA